MADPLTTARTRIGELNAALTAATEIGAVEAVGRAAEAAVASLRSGGQVLFFGNGGSAAEADHLAAELSGRFAFDRPALAGLALGGSAAAMTAIANDYGYDDVFARQVQALGRAGDVVIGMTTSGMSPNVLAGLRAGRERGCVTVAFVGANDDAVAELADILVPAPAQETARVQEVHLVLGHLFCELVEASLFGDG